VIIAIDGPAASGKSTTAKKVAEMLNFIYVDTGSMYRAVTLAVLNAGLDPNVESDVKGILPNLAISVEVSKGGSKTLLDGNDVSEEIRRTGVTNYVSAISAMPSVREEMVTMQRRISVGKDAVVEGRDIGTVVFPKADFKFYFTASHTARAERRRLDLKKLGIEHSTEEIIEDLKRRDDIDSGRIHSPLTRADDAITVDTTNLTFDEQVAIIVNRVRNS
jgi:cytidylate kinase